MNTNDSFSISAFKMLLSVLSLVIIVPMTDNLNDISFYVIISVYVLGKFIDLVAKISQRQLKIFFVIYIVGIIVSIIIVAMCFLGFAYENVKNGITNTFSYNKCLIFLTEAICFVDIADFVFCICKLNYTKKSYINLTKRVNKESGW